MRRTKMLLGSLVCLGVLWLAPSAWATTATIGQAAPAPSNNTCDQCSQFQLGTAPGTPSYVVPPTPASGNPWTLTSWSARGGAAGGSLQLHLWRPTTTAGEFRLVAASDSATLPAGEISSVAANIPVQPGDVLGLRTGSDGVPANYDAASSDSTFGVFGDPAVGQTAGAPTSDLMGATGTGLRLNIAASLSSPDPVAVAPKTVAPETVAPKKKCKKHKKKHKRSAQTAKKKKCKKRKKR
jgi:hypothetical protein